MHRGRSKINMSCFVRKPVFCICENKGVDQLHHDPEDRFSHDMAHIINHEKEHNTKIILLILVAVFSNFLRKYHILPTNSKRNKCKCPLC